MIAFGAALMLGIAKSGIKGLAVLIVTGLALVYGAKESTGILMPLLICGDILADNLLQTTCKVDLSYQTFTLDGSRGLDWGGF